MLNHANASHAVWRALALVVLALSASFLATARGVHLPLATSGAEALEACGAKTSGNAIFESDGVLLEKGAHLRIPARGCFDPKAGAVRMRVAPRWPEGDDDRHTLFHMQRHPHAHVTVFRQAAGHFLFVYKANENAWHAAQLKAQPWEAGSIHDILAAWKQTVEYGLVLVLEIDGVVGVAKGAVALDAAPAVFILGGRGKGEPANAVYASFTLSPELELPEPALHNGQEIEATVRVDQAAAPMPRPFSFVTPWNSSANAIPFTRDSAYFRRFQEAGFEMVRLVAYSDQWLSGVRLARGKDGALELDFAEFDTMVETYLAAGAEPYIRLAYHTPPLLAAPSAGGESVRYNPPRDMAEWREFMRRIIVHCVEVKGYPIHYWVATLNEADIGVRKGTANWDTVFAMYKETAQLLRALAPGTKIGGPATCGPLPGKQEPGLRAFIEYCRAENLPPDFICFHQYGCAHPRDYEAAIACAKGIVRDAWPGLEPECFLDEWNLWARDERANNEYAAAYLAAATHYQIRAGIDRASIVSFNSHLSPEEFAGTIWSHQGPFHKGEAPIAAARFYPAESTIGGTKRKVLYTHAITCGGATNSPYVFGRYSVHIPEHAALEFGLTMAIDHPACDGCGMRVVLHDSTQETTLFETHLRGVGWKEYTVPLAAYANKDVQLEFRTDAGGGSLHADHALWGSPRLVADGREPVDFVQRADTAQTGYNTRMAWHESMPLPIIKGNVVTPAYFTWYLLNRLRGERIPVEVDGRDGIHHTGACGALACRDYGTLRLFVWRFDAATAGIPPLGQDTDADAPVLRVQLPGCEGTWRLRRYLIDHDNTNTYTDYVIKGKDDHGGAYNLEHGAPAIVEDRRMESHAGALTFPVPMPNLSVNLLELEPASD